MNIGYWSPHLTHIATIKAVYNSAYSFKKYLKNNCTVSIINAFGEWDKKKFNKDNVEIINLQKLFNLSRAKLEGFILSRFIKIFLFLILFFPLYILLKKKKFDYFIIHLLTSLPLILFIFFSFGDTKIILRISGLPKLNFFRKFFWKIMLKKVFMVTCPTENTKDLLLFNRIILPEKIFILRDPVISVKEINNQIKYCELNESFNKDKFIIAIGRLTKQKNFEFLIKSFKKICDDIKGLKLKIFGEGEEIKKLKNLINYLDLNNSVFLEGYKSNIYEQIINSEVFVLSSLWEDPGFVLIEAAYLRKTIVSTNCISGPKDFFKNLNYPYLLKNINNINDFGDIIKNAILNKSSNNLKLQLLKKARDYTVFSHCKNLEKILK